MSKNELTGLKSKENPLKKQKSQTFSEDDSRELQELSQRLSASREKLKSVEEKAPETNQGKENSSAFMVDEAPHPEPEAKSKGRGLYNADDSSDPEVVAQSLKKHDLEEQWQRFCAGREFENDAEKEMMRNVFLMHDLGIGVLYSPEVGYRYYGVTDEASPPVQGLKEKYFSSLVDANLVKKIISSTVKRTLKMFFEGVDEAVLNSNLEVALGTSAPFKSLMAGISSGSLKTSFEDGELRIFDPHDPNHNDFFDVVTDVMSGVAKGVTKRTELTNHFSTLYNRAYDAIIPHLKNAGIITENTTASSRKENPYTIGNAGAKIPSATINSPGFPKSTWKKIQELIAQRGKATRFETILKDHEVEIAQAFFADCMEKESLFKKQVRQNLVDQFLFEAGKELPGTYRSDSIRSAIDLSANVRALKRLGRRKERRLYLESQEIGDEYDEYFGQVKTDSTETAILNIGGVPVKGNRSMNAEGSRIDFVDDAVAARKEKGKKKEEGEGEEKEDGSKKKKKGGSYEALYNEFEEFKKSGLDDKIFAKLIRKNLGFPEDGIDPSLLADVKLKKFVAKVTYLIFGCEAERNPASLISQMMMLDLILSGAKGWKDFFVKTEMPMAPDGSVANARNLHYALKSYMPWPYVYDEGVEANDKKTAKLSKAEDSIFKTWLDSKGIDKRFAKEALLVACQDWYVGIDMGPVVYGDNKAVEVERVSQLVVEKLDSKGPTEAEMRIFKFLQAKKLLSDEASVKVGAAKVVEEEEEKVPAKKPAAEKPAASESGGKKKAKKPAAEKQAAKTAKPVVKPSPSPKSAKATQLVNSKTHGSVINT